MNSMEWYARESVPNRYGGKKPWHAAAVSPSPPLLAHCVLSVVFWPSSLSHQQVLRTSYIYILYIIKTLRQHDRPARVVVHTAATGLQPCPNIRKAACCCSGTIYYIYRTEAKGGVDDLGWQVWRLSGHHKERERQDCQTTFDEWQVWRLTAITIDRAVIWQVWRITGLTNDRNVEWH